ncbi:molybdate ABC transporter substrate-binding protein [Cypionkella aquatica]|uniref:Molybdate-binding protein ModA n=1 Tax=Cypionkella aquatica TaxID=1756042 RepID=A0AA37X1Z1_9RHOB|nr:molybdate ABC transporter substrate-binding protein [Cypionkella aquatica]GLS88172.1 molybdate ABC transporter substrate-binding protein [Cypionkella aquatica]
MLTRSHALTAALLASLAFPVAAPAAEITVFAAASLKNALDSIAADWQKETGNSVVISYDSTAKLAKQIEQGAPADVFISASKKWMDTLSDENLINKDGRKDLLGNTLVLVASGKANPVDINKDLDLKALLGDGKLSMGTVDSVPAGQYGKEALESLGLWASVEANVAQSDNVRAALALVAAGEAPYGIVYGSDAIADDESGDKVSVVATFPTDSHTPIVYPAAVTAQSVKPEAQSFLDALSSDASAAVFVAQGFTVLK